VHIFWKFETGTLFNMFSHESPHSFQINFFRHFKFGALLWVKTISHACSKAHWFQNQHFLTNWCDMTQARIVSQFEINKKIYTFFILFFLFRNLNNLNSLMQMSKISPDKLCDIWGTFQLRFIFYIQIILLAKQSLVYLVHWGM
jgi:hypothetical protein